MKIKKRVLNDALRVLGKVVCQTSPVELYRSIRFVGDERGGRGNRGRRSAFLHVKKSFSFPPASPTFIGNRAYLNK